jgi:hypothetical protein
MNALTFTFEVTLTGAVEFGVPLRRERDELLAAAMAHLYITPKPVL